MKKVLILICLILWTGIAFASDISVNEPQPALTLWRLDTVRILAFTKTCEVYYRKGYMDGENFIGTNQGHQIIFMDRLDDPRTPQDETSTEFTQLIQAINSGDNIKQTITKACKIKLGL